MPLRILQLNTYDVGGGAEAVASRLNAAYRGIGHSAWLAVKRVRGNGEHVLAIPESLGHGPWGRAMFALADASGSGAVAAGFRTLARPGAAMDRWRGMEDFRFPGSSLIAEVAPEPPDVLHCHNLHGNYFDLGALAELSRRLPVVLTLHDCWPMSGHCAHSFDCERWLNGCGECPSLDVYPPVRRDATAFNWLRKRAHFANAKLYVATPSRWLMDRVEQSLMAPGVKDSRVIFNGVDDAFFAGGERAEARRALGLDPNRPVLATVAGMIRQNEWKDFALLRKALAMLGGEGAPLLLALGEDAPPEVVGGVEVRYVPFLHDPAEVVRHYRAADVYVHAARVETFSLTIAEAMASALPVVANAVGAVPERIRHLDRGESEPTGILTPPGDADAMAGGIKRLLDDSELRERLGRNGADQANSLYRAQDQARAYAGWFEEILAAESEKTA